MKSLEAYHLAWLAKHLERSESWLRERLADGFHIHHIDGDHSNDAFDNLVLIEGGDHFDLHGMDLRTFARRAAQTGGRRKPENDLIGRTTYEWRAKGEPWRNLSGFRGRYAAKRYANEMGLPWPIVPADQEQCQN
jgi:hypothetical protein